MKNQLSKKRAAYSQDHQLLAIKFLIVTYVAFLLINSLFLGQHFDTYYYWSWGQHLALGYLDGPPLVAYFMRFFYFLLGNTLFSLNIYAVSTVLLASFFIFKIARLLSNSKQTAWVAALLFIPQPLLLAFASYDNIEQLFWVSSVYCVLEYLKTRCNKYLYYAGISLGLLLLSKYSGFILAFGLLTFFIFSPEERVIFRNKHLYLSSLLALLIFSPNIIWNIQHDWITFIFQAHAHPQIAHTHFYSILTLLWSFIRDYYYPILLIAYLIYKHRLPKENKQYWHLIWHVSVILLLFWLIAAYFANVRHTYLLAFNVLLVCLLADYLVKYNYAKILWITIFVYLFSTAPYLIHASLPSSNRQYQLHLLEQFHTLYLLDKKTPVINGGDFPLLAKLLFTNPQSVVSSSPACNSDLHQFSEWSLDFKQQLIAHKIPHAFYVDVNNRPQCIKPYFENCTQLPTLEYQSTDQKVVLEHLYIYQCHNS